MKRATNKSRARMARRHVKDRKRKARVTAARDYMSWQNRDKAPKKRIQPKVMLSGIGAAASMMSILAPAVYAMSDKDFR